MMTMRMRRGLLAVGGVLLLAAPTFAHHSFTAEFDGYKPIELTLDPLGHPPRLAWAAASASARR